MLDTTSTDNAAIQASRQAEFIAELARQALDNENSEPVGAKGEFLPREPKTLEESGLKHAEVEGLIVKYLNRAGICRGREIANQLKLPFGLVQQLLRTLKLDLLVAYKGDAPMNDYEYELTSGGHERAQRHAERNTYCGSAPVPYADYIRAIKAQSIRKQAPRLEALREALRDLVLSPELVRRVGQALNSGRGLFLYGSPGNGKTSLAERVVRAVGDNIWIPRTICMTGEIIRVFDPSMHHEAPLTEDEESSLTGGAFRIDHRWVRIRRPTIIVGGELTIEQLEFYLEPSTGVNEAPLHMKSNGGTLVIDDFGRQRCGTFELLNRWIVPIEKGHDYLTLNSGRKLQVPFDQFLIFSTNLSPKDLVDEAFMRRIPYKIEMPSPNSDQMREIFRRVAAERGLQYNETAIDYLLETYYGEGKHPLRGCLGRDLLEQVRDYCEFNEQPLAISEEILDIAIQNYYAGM